MLVFCASAHTQDVPVANSEVYRFFLLDCR